ncbi:unnamed protein product [Hydatigera taeniaeformis]|uniref:Uncharacterized protein n=1 Tax=Hydatigena taeniaeformis TaxID=6205 RepID=A0A0R3WLR3_HYDTA|nr:unnamed protein product [Hydatigera taeniaeformis]
MASSLIRPASSLCYLMLSADIYVPQHLLVQCLHRGKVKWLPSFIVSVGSKGLLSFERP